MIEPIRLEFEVDCPVEHAFEVWTGRIDQWWPRDHTVSAEERLSVVLEGRPGGGLEPHGGGRVTELMARPLLNLHAPELAVFGQPLAGETAGRIASIS